MQRVAYVKELWRYPVKSMGGELLDTGVITQAGLAGDRLWAVLDEEGEIKSARQWPRLIQLAAHYARTSPDRGQCYEEQVPDVAIRFPEGEVLYSRTEQLAGMLEAHLGTICHLEPLRPPSALNFYRPPTQRNLDNIDVELDRLDDEPDFDFSQTSEEMFRILTEYMTPPGTYFDSYPLHVLSAQVLDYLRTESEADINIRRFRPNLLLDFDQTTEEVPEFGLVGRSLRVGTAVIRLEAKTIRCSIPSRPQPAFGLLQDPKMTRAMVQLMERHIGVYATVEVEGVAEVGDPVYVV